MRHASKLIMPVLLLVAAGCGGGDDTSDLPPDAVPIDAAVAPAFRNAVDLPDDQLALQALQLLGGEVESADRNCNACHSITRARLRTWEVLSDAAMANCLTDLDVTDGGTAVAMTECMREDPNDNTSPYAPATIGFYTTAAELDWFKYLFDLGFGADGSAAHAEFSGRILMPRGAHPSFTQAEFDIIAEWVERDLVLLDDLLPDDTLPGDCTESITAAVQTHVDAMATTGWHAVNATAGINMYGCAGASTVFECMDDQPLASSTGYGATWAEDLPGSQLRVLRVNNYSSAYWTRSSADGRFIAHGGDSSAGGSSTIIDLVDDHLIGTDAFYDPGFFPDNSGFAIQGSSARFCAQSVLTDATNPNYVDLNPSGGLEAGCTTASMVALYQHLGKALGGGDYWTVAGQFSNDNGGHSTTRDDPDADFTGNTVGFVPMVFDGTNYMQRTAIQVSMPNEGDTVMNESATMVVSRIAGTGTGQAGFRLRQMIATPSGGSYTVTTPEIATYCVNGGKPGFSFDERWMVIHHYINDADAVDLGFADANDAGFQAYRNQGAANIYLIDLVTGDKTRVTNMGPGQYALYPHFRSDGWMYFIVRVANTSTEYMVASDAALLVAGN